MADRDEKTIDPTPHRRQQARQAGHVARSQDLTSAALLLAGVGALHWFGGALVDCLGRTMADALSGRAWLGNLQSSATLNAEAVSGQFNTLALALATALVPLLLLALAAVVSAQLAQTGFLFLPARVAPDWSRVNPLAGAGRVFSLGGSSRVAFGVLKLTVVVAVAAASLHQWQDELATLPAQGVLPLARLGWDVCLGTCLRIGLALLALAVLDYGYERWKYERDLKMTPQELREEMRLMQGDPQLLARRRQLERQLALNRYAEAVLKCDLVVVKPGKLAVALRHDAGATRSPVVVARGSGAVAARIEKLARQHKVHIIENGELAERLSREAALGQPINDRLWAAVAEPLARSQRVKSDRV